jgi:hypothetical protein
VDGILANLWCGNLACESCVYDVFDYESMKRNSPRSQQFDKAQ